MNSNALIAGIVVSLFFATILIGSSMEKDEHEKRMELIEEKKELINLQFDLQRDIELKRLFDWSDSLNIEIDKELNKQKK